MNDHENSKIMDFVHGHDKIVFDYTIASLLSDISITINEGSTFIHQAAHDVHIQLAGVTDFDSMTDMAVFTA